MDRLVSWIHPNSINELMPNPFQIDSDKHTDIQKNKAPNTLQNLDKIDISNHHNFRIKQLENSSNVHAIGRSMPSPAFCSDTKSTGCLELYPRPAM